MKHANRPEPAPEESQPPATSSAEARSRVRLLLYAISVLTDFAAFVVVFVASRSLADRHTGAWYLGLIGGGLSFTQGVGSLAGGWMASRLDSRAVFLAGAFLTVASIVACEVIDPGRLWFLPGYWLLGIGLGFLYPALIGWLNHGENAHADHQGVSRRLILFCVAWNVGMMCGQLAGGSLYSRGAQWALGAALAAALVNLCLSAFAARWISLIPSSPGGDAQAVPVIHQRAVSFKRLSWIANLGGVFGGSMVIHLLPDLMVHIGISAREHGNLLACWRAAIIATYLLMHYSGFWHYRLSVSLASQVLGAAGLVLIAQANSDATLLAGLVLLGQLVGYNYFSGLYYSTAGSSHESRALAAGIHEATLATGMALGTVAGGVLGSLIDHRTPYLLGALVIVVLTAIQAAAWWRWVRPLGEPAV